MSDDGWKDASISIDGKNLEEVIKDIGASKKETFLQKTLTNIREIIVGLIIGGILLIASTKTEALPVNDGWNHYTPDETTIGVGKINKIHQGEYYS